MNILIINPILATPTSTGVQKLSSIRDTMMYGMCLGFLQAGHHPTLLAADDYKPYLNEGKYDFPVVFLPSFAKKVFAPTVIPFMPSLSKWLKKNEAKFDLIISKECFSIASLQACIVAHEKLLIWHELPRHQKKLFKMPSRLWHNLIARTFMRKLKTVGVSPEARDFIKHYVGSTVNETIEHGIDETKFFPVDFSKKGRYLITSSQLISRKNVSSIIKKFAKLVADPEFYDVKLIIAGDGDLRPSLEKLSKELGVSENIDFVGFLPRKKLGQLISEALAFVLDSLGDLNVVSFVESVSAGTPVVTNRVPLNSSWIEKEGLGIVRDEWDASDLAEIIKNAEMYAKRCREIAPSLTASNTARRLIKVAQS